MSIFRNFVHRFWSFEKFLNRSLIEKRHTEDTKHIKSASIKPGIMLNNSNKSIGCNSRINLDFYCIFSHIPERLYMQMLLDPFKRLM